MEGTRYGNRRHYLSAMLIALLMALIVGAWGIMTVHADDGAGEETGPGTEAAQHDDNAGAAQTPKPAPAVTSSSNGNSGTDNSSGGSSGSSAAVTESGAKGGGDASGSGQDSGSDTGSQDSGDTAEVTVDDASTGASDINADNSVALEVTNGSATLSEKVLNDSEDVNQLAADPENNKESTQQTFTNDVQSVTITDTYNLTGADAASVPTVTAGPICRGKAPAPRR